MNYIKIGNEQKSLDDASEHWISDQLHRRRSDGANTCVQVFLKTDSIDIVLSTPQCQGRGGGGRQATPKEEDLFDLWAKRGLNDPSFNAGNVMAFLNQVRRVL